MSSFVSRWVVLQQHDVAPGDVDDAGAVRDDTIAGWIANARDEYLDQCREVRERQRAGQLVRFRPGEVPAGALVGNPTSVVVSAGATEIYPTSFTMAFRIRSYGSADDAAVNAACEVSLEDPATGETQELGDAIRDELIALEHAARYTN
jgi:acyl-CoA thioesterase FadM